MVGAMTVLLAVVLAFVGFRALIRDDPEPSVGPVEYAGVAELAQARVDFDVLSPTTLPAGWRATSARHTETPPQSWHLGLLTDDNRYVGLEQARRPAPDMVSDFVDEDAVDEGSVTIDGRTWTVFSDRGSDTALVRRERGVTTLVVGTVSQEELVDYVRTLR
jgi:hypothetical protein